MFFLTNLYEYKYNRGSKTGIEHPTLGINAQTIWKTVQKNLYLGK